MVFPLVQTTAPLVGSRARSAAGAGRVRALLDNGRPPPSANTTPLITMGVVGATRSGEAHTGSTDVAPRRSPRIVPLVTRPFDVTRTPPGTGPGTARKSQVWPLASCQAAGR